MRRTTRALRSTLIGSLLIGALVSPGALAAPSSALAAAPTTGSAQVVKVVDGDSLEVLVGGRREKVRLIGLDAPELHPAECQAVAARTYLTKLIAGRPVRLDADRSQSDRDRYGRLLRHVVLPDGKVAAARMISAGLAREFTYAAPYRFRAAFMAAQRSALDKRIGIWSASCSRPPAGCRIKGNISVHTGERIYHVPGQRYYAATQIDLRKGERWFCTEAQAIYAGWRKSKV